MQWAQARLQIQDSLNITKMGGPGYTTAVSPIGGTIYYYNTLGSTNQEARDAKYGHGDVVVASAQTEGRGQRGNTWCSEPGENLTFSMVLEPVFIPADSQFSLSQTAAVTVLDTLAHYGMRASVKWPNDIYVGDKKISGLLIENDICGTTLSRSIVGIGLNVNQGVFDPSLPNPTSMAAETGKQYDRRQVLDQLLVNFLSVYDTVACSPEDVHRSFMESLFRRDGWHWYCTPSGDRFEGRIVDVETTGEIYVARRDGTIRGYLFKEIEFVI